MSYYTANIGYNDFRTQVMNVEDLLHYYDKTTSSKDIRTNRNYIEQYSRFIEALLLGMPQMPFYVDDTELQWQIIDGIERMEALYAFCHQSMPLTSLYFRMKEYEGITFRQLPPFERNKILNTKIVVHVLNSGLSPRERFGIYVCLKPRMDVATLKWARSIIYHETYPYIEDFAKRMYGTFRRESVENRICCLLVGINYRQFMYSPKKTHIDAAANYLLENPDLKYQLDNWEDGIRRTFAIADKKRALGMSSRNNDLFNAVNYHLYTSGYDFLDRERYSQLLKQIPSSDAYYSMDCAEVFCRNVNELLNLIRG